MEIIPTPLFRRSYKKLPNWLKLQAKEQEQIFRADVFNPRLKTHKLHGKYQKYWAFSVSGPYRIMFDLISQNKVIFINIGDHDIYR